MSTYTIVRMMEDMPIAPPQQVTFSELMTYVDGYNRGTLGHCDAWFSIVADDQPLVDLPIQSFYQYL